MCIADVISCYPVLRGRGEGEGMKTGGKQGKKTENFAMLKACFVCTAGDEKMKEKTQESGKKKKGKEKGKEEEDWGSRGVAP
jgi:hypothetical protein